MLLTYVVSWIGEYDYIFIYGLFTDLTYRSIIALVQGTRMYKLCRPSVCYENVIQIEGGR